MGLLIGAIRLAWFLSVGWLLGLIAYCGGMLLTVVPFAGMAGRALARKGWDIATLQP